MNLRCYNRNEDEIRKKLFYRSYYLTNKSGFQVGSSEVLIGSGSSLSCELEFSKLYSNEYTISFQIIVPFIFSLFFNINWPWLEGFTWYSKLVGEDMKRHATSRRYGFSWYHEFLTIYLGHLDDFYHQSSWREITLDIPSLFFGRMVYTKVSLGEMDVLVPMAEKEYEAKVILYDCLWERPRLPFFKTKLFSAVIKCEGNGIPHPGKGTCGYNCGDSATQSLRCPVRSSNIRHAAPEMVGKFVASITDCRLNYPL